MESTEYPHEDLAAELPGILATYGDNHVPATPPMSETDLLTALTADTLPPSWGVFTLKRTYGAKIVRHRLPIQAIDTRQLNHAIATMSETSREAVLHAVRGAFAATVADETILHILIACCLALRAPFTLSDGDEAVWVPDGTPQDLPRAMIALIRNGLQAYELEQMTTAVMQLNYDFQAAEARDLGNSSAP